MAARASSKASVIGRGLSYEERQMNLKGWKCIFTYGLSLDVYAKRNQRIAVERSSDTVVVRWQMKKVRQWKG